MPVNIYLKFYYGRDVVVGGSRAITIRWPPSFKAGKLR